ncbi:MAG: hypothetical protein ACRDD9_10680, partial [Shewanella sp.]
ATLDLSTGKRLFSVKLVRRAEPLEKAPAVPVLYLSLRCFSALLKHQKKKLIGRGAHLAVPLIGQRDCVSSSGQLCCPSFST